MPKSSDPIAFTCAYCKQEAHKQKKHVDFSLRNNLPLYCSKSCVAKSKVTAHETKCNHCGSPVVKNRYQTKDGQNVFCNTSCAATYNNTHKTKGIRRSKLEVWLEAQLSVLYPSLSIEYCNKAAINGELDIYIPSLRLAFELNGIYHYEPIHGQDKLNQVQSNDHRKFQACIEHGIELVIMDTSQLKYFKEANCLKYLDIIKKIVNSKLLLASSD